MLEIDETDVARRFRRPTTLWGSVVRDGVVVYGSSYDALRGRRSAY